MEWKLSAGDYVPDGTGGLTALSGSGEVLARALYRLTARRGALPFLPALGSRLYQLGRERPSGGAVCGGGPSGGAGPDSAVGEADPEGGRDGPRRIFGVAGRGPDPSAAPGAAGRAGGGGI